MNPFVKMTAIMALTLAVAACGGGSGMDAPRPSEGTGPDGGPGGSLASDNDLDSRNISHLVLPLIEPTGPVDDSTFGTWNNTGLGVGEFSTDADQLMNNWRSIMTFDISQVPSDVTLVYAELVAFQTQVNGEPYFNLGAVLVDHIDMGTTMDGEAYYGHTVGGDAGFNIGTLSDSATPGIKSLDLFGVMDHDMRFGEGRTQLRLRFQVPNNDDEQIDNVFFGGAEDKDPAYIKVGYVQ